MHSRLSLAESSSPASSSVFSARTLWLPLLLVGLMAPRAHAQNLRGAEAQLMQGRADASIHLLQTLLAQNAGNAPAHLLLCRALLAELHGDDAAVECGRALETGLAGNAAAQDWAGRAFGMKAQHAGPVTGLRLAGAVRTAFATAHQLDPHNPAAANDLGEYLIAAPFLVGGGLDKAMALADAVQTTLPEISHRLRALAAEKRGDLHGAEQELMLAVQVAGSPGALVDLANFYIRHNNPAKGVDAARHALAADPQRDANVVDAGVALNDAHQPTQAMAALRSYLDHGEQSDAAPVFRVHTILGEILRSMGNKAGAQAEFQAALALASAYAPAQKGLASL